MNARALAAAVVFCIDGRQAANPAAGANSLKEKRPYSI